jgi:hypothetical protein
MVLLLVSVVFHQDPRSLSSQAYGGSQNKRIPSTDHGKARVNLSSKAPAHRSLATFGLDGSLLSASL